VYSCLNQLRKEKQKRNPDQRVPPGGDKPKIGDFAFSAGMSLVRD
jgi:hypothetical protein